MNCIEIVSFDENKKFVPHINSNWTENPQRPYFKPAGRKLLEIIRDGRDPNCP